MKQLLCVCLLGFFIVSYAKPLEPSPETERMYLVQLVNQLNALLPTIKAAEQAQPKNQRVQFHYSAWHDANGNQRNGLFEDAIAIKKGVEEKLNTTSIEPRAVAPIGGDYLEKPR